MTDHNSAFLRARRIPEHPEAQRWFGQGPEIAHALFVLCITAAERPVIVDADKALLKLPKKLCGRR